MSLNTKKYVEKISKKKTKNMMLLSNFRELTCSKVERVFHY